MEKKNKQKSESFRLAVLLAIVGGFLDAYTYCCRDHVFANAQTGNIVKVGISLANGDFMATLRYFIPIIAFIFGVLIALTIKHKNQFRLHWRQIILLIEGMIIILVSMIPIKTYYNILANILVSFLCAMQAESFRKVLGKPFSSTMCTGNLRSGVEYLYHAFANKNYELLKNTKQYFLIIISFIIGAFLGVLITKLLLEKAILISLIPLTISIILMFNNNLVVDKIINYS